MDRVPYGSEVVAAAVARCDPFAEKNSPAAAPLKDAFAEELAGVLSGVLRMQMQQGGFVAGAGDAAEVWRTVRDRFDEVWDTFLHRSLQPVQAAKAYELLLNEIIKPGTLDEVRTMPHETLDQISGKWGAAQGALIPSLMRVARRNGFSSTSIGVAQLNASLQRAGRGNAAVREAGDAVLARLCTVLYGRAPSRVLSDAEWDAAAAAAEAGDDDQGKAVAAAVCAAAGAKSSAEVLDAFLALQSTLETRVSATSLAALVAEQERLHQLDEYLKTTEVGKLQEEFRPRFALWMDLLAKRMQ